MNLCKECNNFKQGPKLNKFRCELKPNTSLRYYKCKYFEEKSGKKYLKNLSW